ncbi:carbohydrate-binding domain-containing protein [Falsiroseomonas sp.]|uniref:carbohydrate-binding domain-containing protein n=1 Tax=Falsiroseomonas sp. TaxID=2870721 RepID=UPI003569AD79
MLEISQDAFEGDAQYTVSIDGAQVGGITTASALRAEGETDLVTVLGNFPRGAHDVTVSFLNDAWGGTPDTDRNLYVESVSFEGETLSDGTVAFFQDGTQPVGTFREAGPTGRGFGTGPDTLELWISQDDWLGNAQYTVSVDGMQVDGVFTASAERQFGDHDTLWLSREFGPGEHTITVNFLNDAWGGTPDTDRNLYIERVSFNGEVLSDVPMALYSSGEQAVGTFSVPPPPEPVALIGSSGPDRLEESPAHGDVFWGGPDADIFAFGFGVNFNPYSPGAFYSSVLGTGVGPGARDVIIDFEQGEDVIDLSAALQFARRIPTDDEFQFVGADEFSGAPDLPGPPELRYEQRGDFTIVQMDASGLSQFRGDGTVDAEIALVGALSLEATDFIL